MIDIAPANYPLNLDARNLFQENLLEQDTGDVFVTQSNIYDGVFSKIVNC